MLSTFTTRALHISIIVILNSLSDDSNTRVMSDSDGCFVSSDFFSCLLAYFVIFLLITRYVMSIETKIDY